MVYHLFCISFARFFPMVYMSVISVIISITSLVLSNFHYSNQLYKVLFEKRKNFDI